MNATKTRTTGQATRHARHQAARQNGRTYAADFKAGQRQGATDYVYGCHAIPEHASPGFVAGYRSSYRRAS